MTGKKLGEQPAMPTDGIAEETGMGLGAVVTQRPTFGFTKREKIAMEMAKGELAAQGPNFIDYTADGGSELASRSIGLADALLDALAKER